MGRYTRLLGRYMDIMSVVAVAVLPSGGGDGVGRFSDLAGRRTLRTRISRIVVFHEFYAQ